MPPIHYLRYVPMRVTFIRWSTEMGKASCSQNKYTRTKVVHLQRVAEWSIWGKFLQWVPLEQHRFQLVIPPAQIAGRHLDAVVAHVEPTKPRKRLQGGQRHLAYSVTVQEDKLNSTWGAAEVFQPFCHFWVRQTQTGQVDTILYVCHFSPHSLCSLLPKLILSFTTDCSDLRLLIAVHSCMLLMPRLRRYLKSFSTTSFSLQSVESDKRITGEWQMNRAKFHSTTPQPVRQWRHFASILVHRFEDMTFF